MCTVYDFKGFSKLLTKANISFNEEDFYVSEKVDSFIQEIINKHCNQLTFIGAGIERSAFAFGDWVIKVDKGLYTDISDEDARDDWLDSHWSYEKQDYDYGDDNPFGYARDCLQEATTCKYVCEQNSYEIDRYENMDPEERSMVAKLFAVSSNWAVEILERCIPIGWSETVRPENKERVKQLKNNIEDCHDNNLGYNSEGEIVCIDWGFCY